ncbi:MAG: lipoate--protein ligase [Clostridiales bacterium]|nr:lipoate--protein ligase [Clostridiales bacterium]
MLFSKESPVYFIRGSKTSPQYNLASEEYFLYQRKENFIMLWQNEPSVIIGRNQNAYAEIDIDYVKRYNIPVIRRLTGGGAVFHDLGNVNYTLIKNGEDGMVDLKTYLEPVISYLRSKGLDACLSGRNDILVDGMKVSGTAQVNYRGRALLHGTLLFSASLDSLSAALKPNPLKLKAKGIKSVKSRVTNISSLLKCDMDINSFISELSDFLTEREGCIPYDFKKSDDDEINRLVNEKYGTFSWNMGASPPYSFEKTVPFGGGLLTASFDVNNGIISGIKLCGDFFGDDISPLENALTGTEYTPEAVLSALNGIRLCKYISQATPNDLIKLLF